MLISKFAKRHDIIKIKIRFFLNMDPSSHEPTTKLYFINVSKDE